jgi:hypothetical protein
MTRAWRTIGRIGVVGGLLALLLAPAGAQPSPGASPPAITLTRIAPVPGGGPAGPVEISRAGAPVRPDTGIELRAGDELTVGPGVRVLIRYQVDADRVEVLLGPDTLARIGSLFLRRGQAFVRKAKGTFGVETAFGSAASDSTEYLVTVTPQDSMAVAVLEGTVKVSPRDGVGRLLEPTIVAPQEELVVTEPVRIRGRPGDVALPVLHKRVMDPARLRQIRRLALP